MPEPILSLADVSAAAARVAATTAKATRDDVDRSQRWPRETLRSLGDAGLLGLHVPRSLGGSGLGLEALATACEALGAVCPSAALCFGMHSVGTAVLSAKATSAHVARYLEPIARGEHITTLALSEGGTGSHFYLPQTQVRRDGDDFVLDGAKSFVTNGAHADSFVVSTASPDADADPGRFTCFVVDRDTRGVSWGEPWRGFGMRGNESRQMILDGVRLPRGRLLGEVGDQLWYIFEVVAPYFLMAMAGTYVGLCRGILDETRRHLLRRTHDHAGQALADVQLLQHRYASLWMEVEAARALILTAARQADAGDPLALPAVLACKALVGDVVVRVANEAMTLGGGISYGEDSLLARFLRDARAAPVMSPTTDLLKTWCGRALLERPLL